MECRNLIKKLVRPVLVGLLALTAFQAFAISTPKKAASGIKGTQHTQKPKRLAGGVAYFVDFGAETFMPVTPQTIGKEGDKISLSAAQMVKIESILRKTIGPAQFDSYRVRLSIKRYNNEEIILVSKPGVVWDAQGQRALTPAAVVELNHLLNRLLKQQNRKK